MEPDCCHETLSTVSNGPSRANVTSADTKLRTQTPQITLFPMHISICICSLCFCTRLAWVAASRVRVTGVLNIPSSLLKASKSANKVRRTKAETKEIRNVQYCVE